MFHILLFLNKIIIIDKHETAITITSANLFILNAVIGYKYWFIKIINDNN